MKDNHTLTKRIVTVTGDGVKNPGNFYVWLGMNYRQLVDAAGGLNGEPEKFISGGPMTGLCRARHCAPY